MYLLEIYDDEVDIYILITMNNKDMIVSDLLVSTRRANGKSLLDVILDNPVNFA